MVILNASTEAEMQRLMIRIYETMIRANFEGDNNNGSVGSISSADEFQRDNASREVEMELMMRIYKETICPMICAEINAKQQKFLSVIREKFGVDLVTGRPWSFSNTPSTSSSQELQLQFINGISTPVATGNHIKGKGNEPFVLALIDGILGEVVTTGVGASMEAEIVVLEGDSDNDEADNWSSDEINKKIVREWNGRKVLQGNTIVTIKEGIVVLDKYSFTHNAAWKGKRNFRLAAKPVDSVFFNSVKTAITESFLVNDKRKLIYNKKPVPSLSDHVYRLHMISRRGECYKRLVKANIKTVMDLLTVNAINPERLKEILEVNPNTWKVIMDHAQKCKDDTGIYLYHHPRDCQKSNGVVFNIFGQLVGLTAESQFIPSNNLPYDKKADAQELILSSSEHWEEVVSFNSEASLINHLQSRTTLNSPRNSLNVVIPDTIDTYDHTCLAPPNLSTPIVQIGVAGQSQSPKRPAFEQVTSYSQKKPRDDHPRMIPSTPSVSSLTSSVIVSETLKECQEQSSLLTPAVIDDDDWLNLINLSHYDINPTQRWKMVWRVVGWISIFSKVRKRRMTTDDETVYVIEASFEHM